MRNTTIGHRVHIIKQKFMHSLGLPFRCVLPQRLFEEALATEGIRYRNRLFSPAVTVWAFLSQILDQDNSCANAVSRIIAFLASQDQPLPSPDPSAYCQARQRLPEGCGFPLARFVSLFSLATGAILDVEIGAWTTHELRLVRPLYGPLQAGDVALGDSLFCTFADIALLQGEGIEAVFCMHGAARTVDFRRGQKLGRADHLVEWIKPRQYPKGIEPHLFAQLPEKLLVRELRYRVQPQGFRPKKITLATTFTDARAYPKEALADLMVRRWDAELDLRHIKTTLGMEMLTCKTPDMVRQELMCHLLAYNLMRSLLWEAGCQHRVDPLRLSLQNALRHLHHFLPELVHERLLFTIARQVVPKRKGRNEPRMRKRRPKPFPWLEKPRHTLRRKRAA